MSTHELPGYEPVFPSQDMLGVASSFSKFIEDGRVKDLHHLPPYFQALLLRDFADPHRIIYADGTVSPFLLATQENRHIGKLQLGVQTSSRTVELVSDAQVLRKDQPQVADVRRRRRPNQAWAPDTIQDPVTGEFYMFPSVSTFRPSGMGVTFATSDYPDRDFVHRRVITHGEGYQHIDGHPTYDVPFADHFDLPRGTENDPVLYVFSGSMEQPIEVRAIRPWKDGEPASETVYTALRPHKDICESKLIEAPISLHSGDNYFLLVSGSRCFGRNGNAGEMYCVMQTKWSEKEGKYLYREEWPGQQGRSSIILKPNDVFFNPGHWTVYKALDDGPGEFTIEFGAIPWFPDRQEREENRDVTNDDAVRYLFQGKLKTVDGWLEINEDIDYINTGRLEAEETSPIAIPDAWMIPALAAVE